MRARVSGKVLGIMLQSRSILGSKSPSCQRFGLDFDLLFNPLQAALAFKNGRRVGGFDDSNPLGASLEDSSRYGDAG